MSDASTSVVCCLAPPFFGRLPTVCPGLWWAGTQSRPPWAILAQGGVGPPFAPGLIRVVGVPSVSHFAFFGAVPFFVRGSRLSVWVDSAPGAGQSPPGRPYLGVVSLPLRRCVFLQCRSCPSFVLSPPFWRVNPAEVTAFATSLSHPLRLLCCLFPFFSKPFGGGGSRTGICHSSVGLTGLCPFLPGWPGGWATCFDGSLISLVSPPARWVGHSGLPGCCPFSLVLWGGAAASLTCNGFGPGRVLPLTMPRHCAPGVSTSPITGRVGRVVLPADL